MMPQEKSQDERRSRTRFPIHRELRYKLLENETVVESGLGETIDMASGGMAFQIEHPLKVGAFIELAISWPVLLDDCCAMRLIVSGRVVRSWGKRSACRVDKYEFRTRSRVVPVATVRKEGNVQRFPVPRKESLKAAGF